MIYRYDQPVDMPVPELYDTGIMNAYLNAVKDQYESGEKRMDEYLSKYSDFTSPFQQDVKDYDRLVYGRMNNLLDDLQKRGIDPLRSAEGRAAVARLIRTTPVGDIAQLRQSSKIGQQYLAAIQDARRRGEYDQQFEDFLLQQSGLPSFNDFSTLKNGQWDRTAPSVYKTLGKATNDWYDEIKPTDKGSKNGYLWRGIDMNDLINIAKPRAQAFSNTDLGKYYKHLIEEGFKNKYPNATEQEIKEAVGKQFISDIAQSHHEKLIMLPETDPYAMLAEKDKYDRAAEARKFSYSVRLKQIEHNLQHQDETPEVYPASESSIRNRTVTNTQRDNIVKWLPTLVSYKTKYWTNIRNRSKKGSKEYKDAQTYLNYWNAISKNPYNPGKGLTPLLTVDKNGTVLPTNSLRSRYAQDLKDNMTKGNSEITAKYINSKTAEFAGKTATRMKNSISNEWQPIPGTTEKHRVVDYGTGKYTYSAIKVKGMYGRKGSKLQKMFNNWLKSNNIRAYMTGETIRQDRSAGSTTSGVNTYYFNTYITKDKLAEFMKYYNTNSSNPLSENAVMKHLGIVRDTSKQFIDKNKERKYGDLFKFSTSYTEKDNPSQAFGDIEYDKSQYGSSNAYKLAGERQAESLARSENLE